MNNHRALGTETIGLSNGILYQGPRRFWGVLKGYIYIIKFHYLTGQSLGQGEPQIWSSLGCVGKSLVLIVLFGGVKKNGT